MHCLRDEGMRRRSEVLSSAILRTACRAWWTKRLEADEKFCSAALALRSVDGHRRSGAGGAAFRRSSGIRRLRARARGRAIYDTTAERHGHD